MFSSVYKCINYKNKYFFISCARLRTKQNFEKHLGLHIWSHADSRIAYRSA